MSPLPRRSNASDSYRPAQTSSPSPSSLIALEGAQHVLAAGAGAAMATMRTLDDVTLTIAAGDLVMLRRGPDRSARALVGAIAGRHALSGGTRVVRPALRLRRGQIAERAVAAIIAGWTEAASERLAVRSEPGRAASVYLLRVRAAVEEGASLVGSSGFTSLPAAWRSWANALRRQGGAIVLWDLDGETTEWTTPSDPMSRRVRERADDTVQNETGRVRAFTLAAGRIQAELLLSDVRVRPSWSWGDSDAARFADTSRSPTASPET